MTLPQHLSKRLSFHARLSALTAVCFALPLLTGCLTWGTLQAAKQPTTDPLVDQVGHVEKVVLKEHTLLMFLNGRLTNPPTKTRFTLTAPLAASRIYPSTGSRREYGILKLSRDAIHAGWGPETQSIGNGTTVPVGPLLWNRPSAYDKSAKLLPNTTQTIYPLAPDAASGCTEMRFLYVDATAKEAFTVILVDQVRVTKDRDNRYYCLLPLAIAIDIALSPVYLGMYVYWIATGLHM